MKETILKVYGMMCEGCENKVKNVLENIEGVENVTANLSTGEVVITHNNDASKENILEAIERLEKKQVKHFQMEIN